MCSRTTGARPPAIPEGRDYADAVARGVATELVQVDEAVRKASTNWRLERMARVDRNVLRLGAWELLRSTSVPLSDCMVLLVLGLFPLLVLEGWKMIVRRQHKV